MGSYWLEKYSVEQGASGKWYVWHDGERVFGAYKSEAEANDRVIDIATQALEDLVDSCEHNV